MVDLVRAKDLWVADRNFCTLGFLFGIGKRDGFFAVREHAGLLGELLGERRFKGLCDTGEVYEQQARLSNEEGKVMKVRRVRVILNQPTGRGDTEIQILTNQPQYVKSLQVAEVHRRRWTIEGLYFEVAQTLSCEIVTLGHPKAALFAFCLGLPASNAVALLKAALRAVHAEEAVGRTLSAYYLVLEIWWRSRRRNGKCSMDSPMSACKGTERDGRSRFTQALSQNRMRPKRYLRPSERDTETASTSPLPRTLRRGKADDLGRAALRPPVGSPSWEAVIG